MNKNKRFLQILFVSCLFLCNFSGTNPESRQKTKKQESLEHQVTVTLKLVQVYVTDKSGQPVTDLEKSDFELFDNKKRKNITDFEKHNLSPLTSKPESPQSTEVTLPSKKMNRKFFFFFDFAFNNPRGTRESKKIALHFIDTQLQPTDEIGILSYSLLKGITLHEYLTSDHQKIRRAVEKFGLQEIMGRARSADAEIEALQREKAQDLGLPGVLDKSDEDLPETERMRMEAEEMLLEIKRRTYRDQAITYSKKIKDLAKALRYVPGHKHVLLFSSGIITSVLYGAPDQTPFPDREETLPWDRAQTSRKTALDVRLILRDKHEEMIQELNASNCQVYTLDTGGLAPVIDTGDLSAFEDSMMRGDQSLQRVSKATGGKYYGNVRNYEKSLEEIQKVTGSYYILGYYIDSKWDGKYHRIKVKVKRKGYKVHAQGGYFNPKPFTEYSKLEKRIHLMDLALTGKPRFQTPVHFPLKTLHCPRVGESSLVMISRIALEDIQAISGKKVELVNLIFDEQNNIIYLKKWEKDLSNLARKNIYHYFASPLSPGKYECRVVIRNLDTGKGAVASSSVNIPKTLGSKQRISPPLLLIPKENAIYLNIERKSLRERPISLLRIYHYDPSQYAPFVGDLKQGTSRLLAAARYSIADMEQPEIKYSAHLLQLSTGKKIPLDSLVIDRHQDSEAQISLLEFKIGGLQPGKYLVYIFAEELKTRSISHVHTSFTIK